jgi:hypothetical protein
MTNLQSILDQCAVILSGIDKEETAHGNGWWETSVGAEFGARKKQELLHFLTTAITKALGESKIQEVEVNTLFEDGYNQAVKDLDANVKAFLKNKE